MNYRLDSYTRAATGEWLGGGWGWLGENGAGGVVPLIDGSDGKMLDGSVARRRQ